MLYFIKFLVALLLPPGLWIILLILISSFLFRHSRRWATFLICIAILMYAGSISFVSDILVRPLETKYEPSISVNGDVIIVLMGGTTLDTPGIGGPGHPLGESASRLIATVALYRNLGLPIIVSGGQVYADSGNEGEIGKRTLVAMGVPEQAIIVEGTSRSTTENAHNIKPILQKFGFKQPILVTSALHMVRSMRNFEKDEITMIPYPTGYIVSNKFKLHMVHFQPSYDAVNKTGHALKEYLGILALKF